MVHCEKPAECLGAAKQTKVCYKTYTKICARGLVRGAVALPAVGWVRPAPLLFLSGTMAEVDPLDAFMAEINSTVKKQAQQASTRPKVCASLRGHSCHEY